jgi:hypothetical protein
LNIPPTLWRIKTLGGGLQSLIPEPVTMTATQAGRSAAPARPAAPSAPSVPSHYLRRMARFIVLRAALRGRLSWPVALLMLRLIEVQP